MKITLTILALGALLFTGCKGPGWISAKKMNLLSLGMTKPEVVKLLGEPHSSEAREGVDVIWYLEDEGGYKHQPYYVGFKDGKLSTYGRGENSSAGSGASDGKVLILPIKK